ncbi:TPA: hypothetical protein DEO28_03175 [Candidatus Dependentiae bacterium]|nr:MAG: hypothetical protein UR14_C0005G0016 [candidate division TM6 bacterium GW2011_GWE2_31_21]KKP53092.1 MAG: hypothetical protein UR43_C0007G0016 [candidate division TM6 bacterium GW2011_GWF2_33_332]HBS47910.1 hypothetical protein [Candidatus Dependentiae bacterium]HBZ73486.1 hypothetical protein [Candidatus Dependentiae bacterium]
MKKILTVCCALLSLSFISKIEAYPPVLMTAFDASVQNKDSKYLDKWISENPAFIFEAYDVENGFFVDANSFLGSVMYEYKNVRLPQRGCGYAGYIFGSSAHFIVRFNFVARLLVNDLDKAKKDITSLISDIDESLISLAANEVSYLDYLLCKVLRHAISNQLRILEAIRR